jgi:aspartokinase
MNGIKLSSQNFLVRQFITHNSWEQAVHLYQHLSNEKINIIFLNAGFLDTANTIVCCVESDRIEVVKKLNRLEIPSVDCIDYLPSVGIISVYPHQFRLKTLGCLLNFFGVEKYKFHYIASSSSMLSFIIDDKDGEAIATRLEHYIELPKSHTPYRQEIIDEELMKYIKKDPETAASYIERKVKTYGIQAKSRMFLCRLHMELDKLSEWGNNIQRFEDFGLRFCYASSFTSKNNHMDLFLIVDAENCSIEDLEKRIFPDALSEKLRHNCNILSQVDYIHFHGPHFGDRYGIANHALSALRDKHIPVLLAGCVGSSINLVVPKDSIQVSREALSDVFEMP